MGIPAGKPFDARRCSQSRGRADLQRAQAGLQEGRRGRLALGLILTLAGVSPVAAETLRVATFAAPLSRDGPGLLLRDLGRDDEQIDAIVAIIEAARPDILLLTDFDYDLDGLALSAFRGRLELPLEHVFALPPNTGLPTGLDIDRNGRTGEPRDAQGYGRFSGDGGMAILSRWPILVEEVRDFSALLWSDLPGARLPTLEGEPFWDPEVLKIQRLSTTGHWIVPIAAPDGVLPLLAFSATPPVFDGEEDRNGLRNRDELKLWEAVLDGDFGPAPVDFVIAGNANLDPVDGDGFPEAMQDFLSDPRLTDPQPASSGGRAAADADQAGDPALDTADWPDGAPGNLRVSYVLPAASWAVTDAGVFWPAPGDPKAALLGGDGLLAGPHRLVWVELSR